MSHNLSGFSFTLDKAEMTLSHETVGLKERMYIKKAFNSKGLLLPSAIIHLYAVSSSVWNYVA